MNLSKNQNRVFKKCRVIFLALTVIITCLNGCSGDSLKKPASNFQTSRVTFHYQEDLWKTVSERSDEINSVIYLESNDKSAYVSIGLARGEVLTEDDINALFDMYLLQYGGTDEKVTSSEDEGETMSLLTFSCNARGIDGEGNVLNGDTEKKQQMNIMIKSDADNSTTVALVSKSTEQTTPNVVNDIQGIMDSLSVDLPENVVLTGTYKVPSFVQSEELDSAKIEEADGYEYLSKAILLPKTTEYINSEEVYATDAERGEYVYLPKGREVIREDTNVLTSTAEDGIETTILFSDDSYGATESVFSLTSQLFSAESTAHILQDTGIDVADNGAAACRILQWEDKTASSEVANTYLDIYYARKYESGIVGIFQFTIPDNKVTKKTETVVNELCDAYGINLNEWKEFDWSVWCPEI